MAETVHLTLLANGVQIEGDSTQTGREDTIECLQFEQTGRLPVSRTAAMGRRHYEPLRIVKPIDRATPLIAQAFARNESIQATFHFYREAPGGSGASEHFFTVEIRDGRVASIRQFVLDVLSSEVGAQPPQEEVTLAFGTIVWTWLDGGIEAEDTWTAATR